METLYPAGPADVPANYTRPNSSYKRQAWIAVGSLLLFIAIYFALTAWFIVTGFGEMAKMASGNGLLQFIAGVSSLFLAVFMIKALFFIKKGASGGGIQLKRNEQPRLFAFLDRIADEAGAPRPHKVFVTPRVNAAVYYDLSLLNLLFPSRKNLEIGLGLVNMLNLSELKAVLAHEFGHFGQRSMAVGRWVYTTQQIAAHIVGRRDALDRFLRQLSRLDLRIAWVGWLLSVIIWALRAVVDAAFRLVVIAQRALSREMEMQADLVAVSLAGSDAIVHALHRLQLADDAWDRTINFVRGEVGAGKPPRDAFQVQQAIAERLGTIYNDARYVERIQVPAGGDASFRVFSGELAQPPRMWSTHPMNHEREQNAKRHYLFADADQRPAWLAFDDADAVRERMTRDIEGATDHATVDESITQQRLDEQFGREHLRPAYRGIYLGLPATRHARRADELHEHVPVTQPLHLDDLYPARLSDELSQLRSLEREHALLCSLRDRVYDAPDGVIRHRGQIIKRNELAKAIATVHQERSAMRASLEGSLKRVRSLHLAAASKLSPAWHAYLRGLVALVHYAEHNEVNVRDARASLARWWQRATAAGGINEQGVRHILAAASDVHRSLGVVYDGSSQVRPGAKLLAQMHCEDWKEALGKFGLNQPVRANINEWLRIVDQWVDHTASLLSALRRAALDELLHAEAIVASATQGTPPPDAPAQVPSVPAEYQTILVGAERGQHAEKPGFWERFRTASGFFPGLARGAVAIAIVGSVLLLGWAISRATVTVYNGLGRAVATTIDGHRIELQPGAHADVTVQGGEVSVVTQTLDGEPVEAFKATMDRGDTQLIYTVAAASPLRHWTAAYGNARPPEPVLSTPQRWQAASAQYLFSEPPSRVQSKTGSAMLTVLDAPVHVSPDVLVDQIGDKSAANAMLLAHVRFDAPESPELIDWLYTAKDTAGFQQAFSARLEHFPHDMISRRLEEDLAHEAGSDAICARNRAQSLAEPAQADAAYLATRCLPAGKERDAGFEEGHRRWPDSPWFANAAASVASEHGRYAEALQTYEQAMPRSLSLRESTAVEALRLTRLVDPASAQQKAAEYVRESTALGNILAFERGAATPQGSYRAIAMLSNGQLDEAVRAAAGTPMAGHVLRMAAASIGASPYLRVRVAALPPGAGIDRDTLWLALAANSSADSAAIAEELNKIQRYYDSPDAVAKMKSFIELARHGDARAAQAQLDGVPLELRGHAYVAGIYLMGEKAPHEWRDFAYRSLFSVERPYLG